jgi:hypothetical protein
VAVMAERLRMGFFWRILDALDYWLTQARLWVVDVVCAAPCRRRLIGRESAIATVLTMILIGTSGAPRV